MTSNWSSFPMRDFSRSCIFTRGIARCTIQDRLPAVIDTLISAVRAGELDDLFGQAAKNGAIGKARKAL
jgi:hypothetical protein